MPKGTDQAFARKLYDNCGKNACFGATSKEKVCDECSVNVTRLAGHSNIIVAFVIAAGPVQVQRAPLRRPGFLRHHRYLREEQGALRDRVCEGIAPLRLCVSQDAVSQDAVALLRASTDPVASRYFAPGAEEEAGKKPGRGAMMLTVSSQFR